MARPAAAMRNALASRMATARHKRIRTPEPPPRTHLDSAQQTARHPRAQALRCAQEGSAVGCISTMRSIAFACRRAQALCRARQASNACTFRHSRVDRSSRAAGCPRPPRTSPAVVIHPRSAMRAPMMRTVRTLQIRFLVVVRLRCPAATASRTRPSRLLTRGAMQPESRTLGLISQTEGQHSSA